MSDRLQKQETVALWHAIWAAYPADWRTDSSLETWLPLTAEQLKAQAAAIVRLREIVEMAAAGNTEYDVLQRRARATLSGESHG